MKKKGLLAILLTVLIWGSSFAVVKIGLQEIEPLMLTLLRALFASIFLMSIILLRREQKVFLKAVKTDWKYFLVLGLIGITLFGLLQNVGIKYTSSALAGILQNTNPLFILVLSGIFLKEIITKNKILGLVTGFLGVCFIVFVGTDIKELFSSETFLGNVLIIASALSWAIYSILNKRVFKKYSPLHLTSIAYIFGTILLIPAVLIFSSVADLSELSLKSWLIILYLGITCSAIAFFSWNYALSKMDASKASAFLYLIPVIAIFIGWAFMGEEVSTYALLGSGLVLGGVYLTEKA